MLFSQIKAYKKIPSQLHPDFFFLLTNNLILEKKIYIQIRFYSCHYYFSYKISCMPDEELEKHFTSNLISYLYLLSISLISYLTFLSLTLTYNSS